MTEMADNENGKLSPEQRELASISGWLLFFVLLLSARIVVGIYDARTLFLLLYAFMANYSVLRSAFLLLFFLIAITSLIFGIVGIVMLCRKNPKTLFMIQLNLLTYILAHIGYDGMIFFSTGNLTLYDFTGMSWLITLIIPIVLLIIYTTYFHLSVRVRAYMGSDEYLRRYPFRSKAKGPYLPEDFTSEISVDENASAGDAKTPRDIFAGLEIDAVNKSYEEWIGMAATAKSIILDYVEMLAHYSDEAKQKGIFNPIDFERNMKRCNEITQLAISVKDDAVRAYDHGYLPKECVKALFFNLKSVLEKSIAMAQKYNEVQYRLLMKANGRNYSFRQYRKHLKESDGMCNVIEVNAKLLDISYESFCNAMDSALNREVMRWAENNASQKVSD
jgi:hypothetical protein